MSAPEKESFLARWSRRKLRASSEVPAPQASVPAGTPPAAAPAAANPAAPAPELPPLDSLQGLASEYRDFLRPGVDEKLRTAALKRLFRDPHFNVMDGLDVYIDDYTRPDPIPEAMLRTLEHARGLLFGATGEAAPEEKPGEAPARGADEAKPERTDAGTQDEKPGGKAA